jgi:hypothetical protein
MSLMIRRLRSRASIYRRREPRRFLPFATELLFFIVLLTVSLFLLFGLIQVGPSQGNLSEPPIVTIGTAVWNTVRGVFEASNHEITEIITNL